MRFLTRFVLLSLLLLTTACTLNEPAPTPMPTPDLPQVRFLTPYNNTRVYDGTEMTVDILAEDTTSGIVKVEFYVDGVLINEGAPEIAAVPSFRAQMNWFANGVGGHTLKAIAYRLDGTASIELPGTNFILTEVVPTQSDE